METNQMKQNETFLINANQLLLHWQGHRQLTRKLIEVFPEDKLFTYAIGGMRPFAEMVMELLDLAGYGVEGIATGHWKKMDELSHVNGDAPTTKTGLLASWDAVTIRMNQFWPQLANERFQQIELAFGLYEGPVYSTILYFIDNEVHHRGQAYVYLRSLGITPPPFWERN
ncbi:MAG: DinB family protein [Sphingobacteriaceae bacterium]